MTLAEEVEKALKPKAWRPHSVSGPAAVDVVALPDAVSVAVALVEKERARVTEPPYPYIFRKAVQRLKATIHRMRAEMKRQGKKSNDWKLRYKSSHPAVGQLQKKLNAAEKERETAIQLGIASKAQLDKMEKQRDDAVRALEEFRQKWAHVAGCQCGTKDVIVDDGTYWMDVRCAPKESGR